MFCVKKLGRAAVLLCMSLYLIGIEACNKNDDNIPAGTTQTFTATLTGAAETPPVATAGNGTFTANYNMKTNKLSFKVTWKELSDVASAIRFYKGKLGEAGEVEIPIMNFAWETSGMLSAEVTVDEDEEADLFEGHFYINIHTNKHLEGEIRGQLERKN